MSRSWERKVRKNMSSLNKQRKKQGNDRVVLNAEKSDRIVGRNYIIPILLILFIGLYVILLSGSGGLVMDTMFWVTIGLYLLLAVVFFFRRPYLKIGKDYVQTRKFTGDKRLSAESIKAIKTQPGYVVIEQKKGSNWVFSKVINRYPIDEMAEKLNKFAQLNGIEFEQK